MWPSRVTGQTLRATGQTLRATGQTLRALRRALRRVSIRKDAKGYGVTLRATGGDAKGYGVTLRATRTLMAL